MPSRTMYFAQGVDCLSDAGGLFPGGQSQAQSIHHAHEGPRRVDCQGNIVEDDKKLEQPRSANGPRLVLAITVDRVQECDDGGVDKRNGDGHVRR